MGTSWEGGIMEMTVPRTNIHHYTTISEEGTTLKVCGDGYTGAGGLCGDVLKLRRSSTTGVWPRRYDRLQHIKAVSVSVGGARRVAEGGAS